MAEAREWPNTMAQYRDEAALEALRGLDLLNPIINRNDLTTVDVLMRISKAREALFQIEVLMLAAGAKVRPIQENNSPLLEQGTGRRITDKVSLPNYNAKSNR